jgi:hypothetical protein
MTTPNGDSVFELELTVRTELTVAEASPSEVEVDGLPAAEWPADPEAERYDAYLRTLLGAVESVEDGAQGAGPLGDGRD